jgi:hypothetical protein
MIRKHPVPITEGSSTKFDLAKVIDLMIRELHPASRHLGSPLADFCCCYLKFLRPFWVFFNLVDFWNPALLAISSSPLRLYQKNKQNCTGK